MLKIWEHIKSFFPIWVCFLLLVVAAGFAWSGNWHLAKIIGGVSLIVVIGLLVLKPMNAVFGLMGTTGDIRLFFVNFIFISGLFAAIYYYGFFQNAGISYDVNQPHIEYDLFKTAKGDMLTVVTNKRIPIYKEGSSMPVSHIVETEEIHYQKIKAISVISNTVMTSLMQEPSELFSAAATGNQSQDSVNRSPDTQTSPKIGLSGSNVEKSQAFHIILIFQILISWIFFGVFISLLYSKFRYES